MSERDATAAIAGTLGEWISGLRPGNIPAQALDAATSAIVDLVGVAFAGSRMPVAKAVAAAFAAEQITGPCSVIGSDRSLGVLAAANLNAVSAHALDFDANFSIGMVFGPAVFLPSLIAIAQQRQLPGADVKCAYAVAVEITHVLAEALSAEPYSKAVDGLYRRGWFNSAVLGPIGAAAGVSHLLRFDADQAARAVAIAAIQAGGVRLAVGSDMKPVLCGLAAESGVRAALLAASGVEPPVNAFEGKRGFIEVINHGAWMPHAFRRLGQFSDPGMSFKLYPSCSSVQAAVEALDLILTRERIQSEKITHVLCEVSRHIANNLTFPEPVNVTQAQFSMPFAIGCLLARGHYSAADLVHETVWDADVRRAMTRVQMSHSPDLDTEDMRRNSPEATRVTVTCDDGRSFSHLQASATGKPENPISDGALDRKFMANVAPILPVDRADVLLSTLRALSDVGNMRHLFSQHAYPVNGIVS